MKKIRKPYLSILLALLIFSVSCTQETEFINKKKSFGKSSYNLAKNQFENLITKINLSKENISDLQKKHLIMKYSLEQNNLELEFSESFYQIDNKTTKERFDIAINTGIFNERDIELFKNLTLNFENDNETFENIISTFEDNLIRLNLNNDKFEVFNIVINSLKLINNHDKTYFQNGQEKSWQCIAATIGLASAVVGMGALTAASGGLAVGAAIVVYIAAVASFVDACELGD